MRAMKDSGIPWLGQIPEHWEVMRNKDIFQESKEVVGEEASSYTLLSLTKQGVIVRDLTESKGKFPKEFDTYKKVTPNDMVFCLFDMDETPRTIGLSNHFGMITGAYDIFKVKRAFPRYVLYYFLSVDDQKAFRPLYKGLRKVVQMPTFLAIRVPVPPLLEQERIAEYLDGKCAEIDELISVEEQMIVELQAYKQSVITETVTRGLNPDAPLKDSGIPWLGQIPEHWEVKMLSSVAKEHYISNENVHHQNLLSLSYGKIVNKDIGTREGLLPASFDTYQIVEKGNIVLRLTDLQNDQKSLRVGLSLQEGIITSAYLALEVRQKTDYCYLYYLLHTIDTNKVLYGMGSGVRQNLKWQELKRLPVLLPPLPEQKAIAEYLDRKCEEIDALVEVKQRKIEELKEYKKSVIYEYVTGKREIV